MATIRKRPTGWQARVQRKGYSEKCKTFKNRNDAIAWGRMIESEMDRGIYLNRTAAESTTLSELLTRYLNEITPDKKGASVEHYRIKCWLKTPLANRRISTIKTSDFASWRDSRIKSGAAANTVRLELSIISNLFNVAKSEWGFESLTNPTEHMRTPKLPSGRTRRVSDKEIDLLIKNTESYELPFIIKIALESGMRRGEIASLEWRNINFVKRTVLLPDTKNGEARIVPLTTNCMTTLQSIPRNINGSVFTMTENAISRAFLRVRSRCGLDDMHFHDIRHEAITRFFEKGLNMMEVSAISGHKTLQMLKRYTHLRAEDLAKKLG
jgi:integrase